MEISGENLQFLIKVSKVIQMLAKKEEITEENAIHSTFVVDSELFRNETDIMFLYHLANNHPIAIETPKYNRRSIVFNERLGLTPDVVNDILDYLMIDKTPFMEEIKLRYTEKIPLSKSNQKESKVAKLKENIKLHNTRLLYWITHSELLKIYAEYKGITENNALNSRMTITPENFDFPNGDIDWLLLTDLIETGKIGKNVRGLTIYKNNYTEDQIHDLLDYIHFMTPQTMWGEINRKFITPEEENQNNGNYNNYSIDSYSSNGNSESNNENIVGTNSNENKGRENARIAMQEKIVPYKGTKATGLTLGNFIGNSRGSNNRKTRRNKEKAKQDERRKKHQGPINNLKLLGGRRTHKHRK